MPDRLLKRHEAAERLTISESQLGRLSEAGGPLAHARVRIGRSARWSETLVEAFIAEHLGRDVPGREPEPSEMAAQ